MSVGALIRELRSTLGWSQGRLASALCEAAQHATVTREDVSRWEHGKRRPGPFWMRHLAAVLQVPLQVLERADVHRRDFITSVAATLIAPIVASDLIEAGFAAALTNRRLTPDEWQEKIDRYGCDYMSLGAAEMQQRLTGELVVLHQQLEEPKLWGVASRLMTLYAAWKMDAVGKREARQEISMIKVVAANICMNVIDRAIQVHGALGVTADTPLERMYREARYARLYDGPDEVHRMVVARTLLSSDPASYPWS